MKSSIISSYDWKNVSIGTICSHSALQIFAGAKEEGFSTVGICTPDRADTYRAFPHARPDEIILVESYKDILKKKIQDELLSRNVVLVPHGSFVEYVGASGILDEFKVPIIGNREVLLWEGDRERQRKWLSDEAGISMPRTYLRPEDIDRLVIVKMHGAKGGSGYFLVRSADEFYLESGKRKITFDDVTIQEYLSGVRYYVHFFYSPISSSGYPCGDGVGAQSNGSLEITGVDRRDESNIDELHRVGVSRVELSTLGIDVSFNVTGNTPCVLRESLLLPILEAGRKAVVASQKLFSPGIIGPFCLECVVLPDLSIRVFEISARIVAGTNAFTHESPYSHLFWGEPMSCGRRIAREVRMSIEQDKQKMIFF